MRKESKNNQLVVNFNYLTYLVQGIFFSILLVMLQSGCNDPTLVGTSLFDDDALSINFTDTVQINAITVKGDTSIHSNGRTYLVGIYNDYINGTSQAELYLDIRRNGTPKKKLYKANIEKVELVLNYDTIGYDESLILEHNFEVRMFSDTIPDTIYTNTSIDLSADLITKEQPYIITPDPRKKISVLDYVADSLVEVRPQLRIELSDQFKDFLTGDTLIVGSDSLFKLHISGLHLKSNSNSLIGFNMLHSSYIQVQYNYEDTLKYVYKYPVGTRRFSNFVHDYSGSEVLGSLENNDINDDKLYLHGMSGTNLEIDLSGIESFNDKHLNYAELECYVHSDYSDFLEAEQLLVFYTEDGKVIQSIDASLNVLNGNVKTDDANGLKKYNLALTSQIKAFLEDETLERKILIAIFSKNSTSNTSVLYGTNHPKYPMRLKAVFTDKGQ